MKRKFIILSLTVLFLFGAGTFTSASENSSSYLYDILILQPDVTSQELLSSIQEVSNNTGESENQILEHIYKELKENQEQGLRESKTYKTNVESQIFGGTGGTVSVGSSTKGNFYYTPSQTAYLDHGHVGMYYTPTTIVESVPTDGVRTISTTARKVDSSGALVKSVNTSTANRDAAANWAFTQVGENYSYNFATNRITSYTGAKNCSKLIWAAFKQYGNLDLDDDGGLGVYPRDIRDAPDTTLVRNI
ncbi:hypothetical protein KD050_07830 [Psychrobacillus sp. INOP01]|uniref:hypothetical protein n=1 Tax=Psychrobacillus sp. INOP01 TaxID=2829187 RepID=UPI001BABAD46|nr:hypothetical protein [Psychrobacillus sp. INOP01]QUG43131.1 hypothetical protein KD050_07830 [Psychrobacillus sp. INOP01]